MKIAIVILNWNGTELLKKFLPSVIKNSGDHPVYVIDNGSKDNSVAWIKANHPQAGLVCLDDNHGYAGGYNLGLKQIEEEIYILLNSDVEVSENWLEPIQKLFNEDNQCVAAQPKILSHDNRELFDYAGAAGGYLDRLGYPFCRGRIFDHIEHDQGQYDDSRPIFWASGACLIVRKEAYWAVGGLDPDFFAHQEEIDLCWRLQTTGGRIMYIPDSKIFHLGGGTLSNSSPRKTYLNFRNSLLLLYKNVKGAKIYVLLLLRLVLDALAILRFLMQGSPNHATAVIRAHIGFYRLVSSFRPKRKQWSSSLKYFEIGSIVWRYFLLKKRTFNEL